MEVENICRLCCEKKARLMPLFQAQKQPSDRPLPDIISDILRVQVEQNDGMPQKVCRLCSTTLLKIYETIENYRLNDLKLRQQLGTIPLVEVKEEEVDFELLEKAFSQELNVLDVSIKEEVMEEEYLESEMPNYVTNMPDKPLEGLLKQTDDESEEESTIDNDEWTPEKERGSDIAKPTKAAVKRKIKTDANSSIVGPRRRRRKKDDPDRPRKHDFKCYICRSDSLGTPEALLDHLNSSHQDLLPYTCPECVMETVVIKTVLALNSHMRQHLNPEKCPFCDKRYTCKNNVTMHVQMHHTDTGQSELKCNHCQAVFASKSSLNHHMKSHTTAVTCEICGKIFKERSKLQRHIQNRHEKLRKYECNVCQKKLASLDGLQLHVKTYHSTQMLKCSFCPKTFGAELSLRYHEKRHLENPDYEPKNDWKKHYTVLDAETKMKKCNLCGIKTRGIGSHLSRVHFPTEYRCKICDTAFKSKQTCVIHELEHEHGKAHSCPICGREFSERKLLICHLRTKKHQDNPLAQEILSTVRPAYSTTQKDPLPE